jgi:EmrB/QacA subfamily drug resistance transporter
MPGRFTPGRGRSWRCCLPGLTPPVRNAVLALIVGGIAAILDSTMVTLALHTLTVTLHATDGTIQWVTTGYLLAMAVAIPVTGWAESRWGGKRTWMAALLVFVGGSVLCALAWSAASLIAFRVLQGLGAGLIFPLMQTLAVRAAGGKASSKLVGLISMPLALGPILGPVIGGVILSGLSWRWLFLVNVPVIAVGLLLAWRLLPADRPDPQAARPRLDVTGLALLAPALTGILLGLSNLTEDGGLGSPAVYLPLLAGLVLLGAFTAWALRPGTRHPIVDIRLLRHRSLGTASAVLFTAGAAMYAGMFLLPLVYQQLHGESVLYAGLLLIPQGIGSLVSRFAVGGLVARFGARAVTIASFLLTAAATVPFAVSGRAPACGGSARPC